jgi:hypothetical protein
MATPTYDLIASSTLTASATSVEFAGISQDYRDLVLIVYAKGVSDVYPAVRFNNSSSSFYSSVIMSGDGTNTNQLQTASANAGLITGRTWANATYGNLSYTHIMDYSATDKHKMFLSRAGQSVTSSGTGTEMQTGRWPSYSAITSIQIVGGGGTFAASSTFHLYGIEG